MSSQKPFVAHIGGAFIYSERPKELADWYQLHLGILYETGGENGPFYASFPYTEITEGKKAYVAWSILPSKNRPRTQEKYFCINYRVNDLEKMVDHLRSLGVLVRDIENYPEGKFAWLNDPDGNYIELWEDSSIE